MLINRSKLPFQTSDYNTKNQLSGVLRFYCKHTVINIRFDKPLYKAAPKTYRGTVRWCKELARDDFDYLFGVGVKYD